MTTPLSPYNECVNCRGLFRPKRKDMKFCSSKCRKIYSKRLKRGDVFTYVKASPPPKNVANPPQKPLHKGVPAEWKQHGPHPEGQFYHELCGRTDMYLLRGGGVYCPFCQSYGESVSRWPRRSHGSDSRP